MGVVIEINTDLIAHRADLDLLDLLQSKDGVYFERIFTWMNLEIQSTDLF